MQITPRPGHFHGSEDADARVIRGLFRSTSRMEAEQIDRAGLKIYICSLLKQWSFNAGL